MTSPPVTCRGSFSCEDCPDPVDCLARRRDLIDRMQRALDQAWRVLDDYMEARQP